VLQLGGYDMFDGSKTDRETVNVEEFALRAGISRGSAYEAVRRGDVQSIRLGRRILIPGSEISRLRGSAQ